MFGIRELYASLASVAAISTGAIFWLHFSRFTTRGTLWWSFAMLSFFSCLLCISLRGSIPAFISVVVANIAAIWGYIFIWYGIRAYLKRPFTLTIIVTGIIPTIIVGIGFYWFTFIQFSLNNRIAIFCFATLIFNLLTVKELQKHTVHNRTAKIIIANNILNAVILLIRGTSLLANEPLETYFSSGWQTVLFLLWSKLSLLISTFGLILMIIEDLNTKLEYQATEDPLTGLLNRRALHIVTPDFFIKIKKNHKILDC